MISYKQWKLLNESLGTHTLGVRSPQNMGFVSAHHTGSDCDSCGNPIEEMGFPMKKKFPPQGGDMGGMKHPHPHDDMGDEDMDMDGEEDSIDPDADIDDMGDEGDEDMDDMGDEGDDDMGGDDMGDEGDEDMPFPKKKKPMGEPHMSGPFMNFSRRMKEGCGDKGKDKDMGDDDKELSGKEDGDKELSFLQKKTMKKKMSAGDTAAKDTKLGTPTNSGKSAPKGKGGVKKGTPESQNYSIGKTAASHSAKLGKSDAVLKKGCSSGEDEKVDMCKKCKKSKKMKESNDYSRPQPTDFSDRAFINSLKSMYGNPHETFSDGLRDVSEDLLLHPDLVPGEAGHPQSLHNHNEPAVTESLGSLQKRIAELEKQLRK